jgi:hypothetical protein
MWVAVQIHSGTGTAPIFCLQMIQSCRCCILPGQIKFIGKDFVAYYCKAFQQGAKDFLMQVRGE